VICTLTIIKSASAQVRGGIEPPTSAFRITDHRAGPATEVCRLAQRPAVPANRRQYTWMYETTNKTAQTCSLVPDVFQASIK
jgi:hypothetical protein